MALSLPVPPAPARPLRRYLRPPAPLHFPVHVPMPETDLHLLGRIALYESVRLALGDQGLVSSDQFVYWDATDPKKCLAPDLGVRVGAPRSPIDSWKIWERGAPQVGVELVSDFDRSDRALERRLERYRQAGVLEVVRFDPRREPELRLWDLVDGDLVERDPADPEALRCDAMGLYWCIKEEPGIGRVLRLARDKAGLEFLPTPAEAARESAEAARAAQEIAEARVRELEALLSKRDA